MRRFTVYKIVCIFAIVAVICTAFTDIVNADTNVAIVPGWVGGSNGASISVDDNIGTVQGCVQKEINVVIINRQPFDPYSLPVMACVYSGDGAEVAQYWTNRQSGLAVKLSGDGYFKQALDNRSATYSPVGDVLVYQGGDGTRLKAIRNFSNVIMLSNDEYGEQTKYTIPSSAEVSLPKPNSKQYEAPYHALSRNGRYVATYVDYKGIVRIDLETGEETAIAKYSGSWYQGLRNVRPRAISDDGRYILLGPSLKVIDARDCGRRFDGEFNHQNWCEIEDFKNRIKEFVKYEYSITYARFTDNSYGVEFEVERMPGTRVDGETSPKHITVRVGEVKDRIKLDYLALGDSYSSGEGDVDDDGFWYKNGTDKYNQCHLSLRSYPYLLSDAWGIDNSKMASVACSGALLRSDYTSPIAEYSGQHSELVNLTSEERQSTIDATLDSYAPGIVPQIEFVKRYKPKVVTITGGGNDVGFAEILQYCASDFFESIAYNYSCEYVKGGVLNQILEDSINTQYTKMMNLIEKVKEASPGVKIYYVGYPSFISGSGANCFMSNVGVLDGKERDMINGAIRQLNGVIRKAAAATEVQYVDIESALSGGRLCEGSKYMTGIWAAGVVNVLQNRGQEAFHPNSKGHKKISETIISQLSDSEESYTPTGPDVVTVNPDTPTSRARIVQDPELNGEEMLEILLVPNTVPGASDIFVTGYSKPTKLGTYKADENGALNASIKLPSTMRNGKHLIVLDVYSEGVQIERLYDFIVITRDKQTVANSIGSASVTVENKVYSKGDSKWYESDIVDKFLDQESIEDMNTLYHSNGNKHTQYDESNRIKITILICSCILSVCILLVLSVRRLQNK